MLHCFGGHKTMLMCRTQYFCLSVCRCLNPFARCMFVDDFVFIPVSIMLLFFFYFIIFYGLFFYFSFFYLFSFNFVQTFFLIACLFFVVFCFRLKNRTTLLSFNSFNPSLKESKTKKKKILTTSNISLYHHLHHAIWMNVALCKNFIHSCVFFSYLGLCYNVYYLSQYAFYAEKKIEMCTCSFDARQTERSWLLVGIYCRCSY